MARSELGGSASFAAAGSTKAHPGGFSCLLQSSQKPSKRVKLFIFGWRKIWKVLGLSGIMLNITENIGRVNASFLYVSFLNVISEGDSFLLCLVHSSRHNLVFFFVLT